ncbi:calvin cycle protein CP12-3, chloroplastic-like [Eucalyptus grandis]|uniref:calvin cycle protein CP12-3, chloroplastic-like n=1 Tax=Eucalyptus grandis TaxID=71139 RepID=UPI00192ED697|nr:calvin cycle protein CP12-3, chloroplastic-like [Eucalyptus grandis]
MASSSLTLLNLSLPFSSRPILFPSTIGPLGVAARRLEKRPSAVGVRAAGGGGGGGAKYKGTRMRERRLREMIEEKVAEAKEACEGEEAAASAECRVAWDEVEEVSQAKAHLRLKLEVLRQDPLESFCGDNPETDECHVYGDDGDVDE